MTAFFQLVADNLLGIVSGLITVATAVVGGWALITKFLAKEEVKKLAITLGIEDKLDSILAKQELNFPKVDGEKKGEIKKENALQVIENECLREGISFESERWSELIDKKIDAMNTFQGSRGSTYTNEDVAKMIANTKKLLGRTNMTDEQFVAYLKSI